jgi:hypothetical protein
MKTLNRIAEIAEMFSECMETVYDAYGNKHQTEIKEVETLPNISWCGNEPEGYRGYRNMASYGQTEVINPYVALYTSTYNAGAAGEVGYIDTIYVIKGTTLEDIEKWEESKKAVSAAMQEFYASKDAIDAANERHHKACYALAKAKGEIVKKIVESYFPEDCSVKVSEVDNSISVREPSCQDGFCGPYNEKKAAKLKALKGALEQHCFYILREYTWLSNTYWEIGY